MPGTPCDLHSKLKQPGHLFGGRYFVWLAAVNTFAAILSVSLLNPSGEALAANLLISLVYAHSIGWLAGLALPFASQWIERAGMPLNLMILGFVLLGITAAGSLLGGAIIVALGLLPPAEYWGQFTRSYRFQALVVLAVGSSAYFYQAVRSELEEKSLELRTRELERERADKLAAEARLSALASRVHPHFLFNTLNAIASLIPEDPKRAEQVTERLSSLLRFSLESSTRGVVPLRREVELVRDYLEIEKARFGERLRYSVDIPDKQAETLVPPLSIQTLVENSVKHAVAVRREGGEIRVRVGQADEHLVIEVTDNGAGFSAEDIPPGHGLDNLRSRLSVLYGDRAKLEVGKSQGLCTVRLGLPLHAQIGECA